MTVSENKRQFIPLMLASLKPVNQFMARSLSCINMFDCHVCLAGACSKESDDDVLLLRVDFNFLLRIHFFCFFFSAVHNVSLFVGLNYINCLIL